MTKTDLSGEYRLKRAIRAGRTGSEDVRLQAIEDAGNLALLDLIPDAWGDSRAGEKRETAKDLFTALEGVVQDAYPDRYTWVQDWDGEDDGGYRVIYQVGGDLLAAPFSSDDDGKIELGDSVKVRPITGYIERAAQKECTTCDGTGKIKGETTECPDCNGSGVQENSAPKVAAQRRARHTRSLERRKARLPKRGEREIRTLPIEDFELRDSDEKEGVKVFEGYASVFNRKYDIGPYEERILPSAFKRSLKNPELDCVLRMEHEDLPLARTSSGTLILREEGDVGLKVNADLALDDPDVQRLIPKMRRGDLREMSFAFRCTDDDWSDDYLQRDVKAADIHRGDVSIVTYGASPTTSATLRHAEEAIHALRGYGADAFIEAWVEWRDYTLLAEEDRAGKSISASNMEVLSSVLNLVASADEAVDEAQPLLAELMGVPNPDVTERTAVPPGSSTVLVPVNYALRARARRLAAGR